MDRLERQLVNLPLLQDPSSYIPDTMDLTEDALAREYWLYCFEEALDGVGWKMIWNTRKSLFKMIKWISLITGFMLVKQMRSMWCCLSI